MAIRLKQPVVELWNFVVQTLLVHSLGVICPPQAEHGRLWISGPLLH